MAAMAITVAVLSAIFGKVEGIVLIMVCLPVAVLLLWGKKTGCKFLEEIS